MQLAGSCHCGAVRFTLHSDHPYPYMLCYCSICRKTAGSGGYAINIGGEADTLEVHGREHLRVYRARVATAEGPRESPAERSFCELCASTLWVWDPRWPELIHPFASAIDTPLPTPPQRTHIMLDSKPDWVAPLTAGDDRVFADYPDESIAEWHARHGFHPD